MISKRLDLIFLFGIALLLSTQLLLEINGFHVQMDDGIFATGFQKLIIFLNNHFSKVSENENEKILREDFMEIDNNDVDANGFPHELNISFAHGVNFIKLNLYKDASNLLPNIFTSENGKTKRIEMVVISNFEPKQAFEVPI